MLLRVLHQDAWHQVHWGSDNQRCGHLRKHATHRHPRRNHPLLSWARLGGDGVLVPAINVFSCDRLQPSQRLITCVLTRPCALTANARAAGVCRRRLRWARVSHSVSVAVPLPGEGASTPRGGSSAGDGIATSAWPSRSQAAAARMRIPLTPVCAPLCAQSRQLGVGCGSEIDCSALQR